MYDSAPSEQGDLPLRWSRVEASWRRKRQKRLDLLQDLARRVLGRELVSGGGPESYENTVAESVLRAVRQYQDQRPRSERCAPPTFGECCAVTPGLSAVRSLSSSAGGLLSPMLQHAGLVKDEVDVDPEDLLCEDVRCWLSSTSRGELERHLGFYRQVLMRPEVFAEDPRFFHLLVFLCERLEELLGRLSVTSRDCATQLAKVISIGKELLDGLLPVLLLSICDLLDGPTPLLSIETLLSSIETPIDGFAKLWDLDCGRILYELLRSQHFRDFWELRSDRGDRGQTKLLDLWLELRHSWVDALDEGEDLALGSGIHQLFRSKSSREVQQQYLDLYKQLDNLIKFLSMVAHYRRLANIAGDAAMYHLRSTLHHLLQEIEIAVANTLALVSRIMEEVRRTVMNITSGNAKGATGRTLTWLGRLQMIDELSVARSATSLLEAIQELRFLSSDSRLPELRKSCQQSLQQICEITASVEFRSRCAEVPPTALLAPDVFVGDDVESPKEDQKLEIFEGGDASLQVAEVAGARIGPPAHMEAAAAQPLEALRQPLPPSEASRSTPPSELQGKKCQQDEQDRFYELFFAAVLPLLGDGTSISIEQATSLLQKGGLSEQQQQEAFESVGAEQDLESEELRRVLERMARVQDGDQASGAGAPRRIPWIHGLLWDGRRLRIGEGFYAP
ncbi:unnamed protein product [Durusdinium trenchii]|uniref:Anaphase-promoting complex subunit 4 n=1 Tax=Durusdinium trenchii TaxID=1381693 RepID=A0ABP0M9H7_9DINO